jgi:hypothetical protein
VIVPRGLSGIIANFASRLPSQVSVGQVGLDKICFRSAHVMSAHAMSGWVRVGKDGLG